MAPLTERDANVQTAHASDPNNKPNAGKKRKSDGPPPTDPDSIDIDGIPMDMNANQVRSKIRAYLNSGEMKVGEFQSKIGVSSKGYGDFMKQSGASKGICSNTYYNAFEFFKKRELAGLKMPRKKQKTAEKSKDAKDTNSKKNEKDKYDVSDIHLEGEDKEDVPIFDTCDDIRKKINAHLRAASTTNIGFVRQIAETFPHPTDLAARHLTAFLGKKGPKNGADSPIYYATYVYFEKLRIKNKKAKSKKREEMEEIWDPYGVERRKQPQSIILFAGEKWHIDEYGQDHISGQDYIR
jgi:hypothetical protein